jgi:hypothetical protein
MNRGLTLKCLQCDSHEFHILYEMGPQSGGVPHPRPSGSYECVQWVLPGLYPHTRAAPGAAPLLAGDRNPLGYGRGMLGQPQGEHAVGIRGLELGLIHDRGHPEGAIVARNQ